MSLTSFTRYSKELKEKFKTDLRRPNFRLKSPLLARPISQNYSIVGQAFDYLLRFYLERRHKNIISNSPDWVASLSINNIIQRLINNNSKHILIERLCDVKVNKKKFLDMLLENYKKAEDEYKAFLKTGKTTPKLLESCLFLARLDVTTRAGMIDSNFGNEIEDDIIDLDALYKLINEEHFTARDRVLLNPTFIGGGLVGGADADLVLDNTLIDIKTTKNLELERKDLNQIIGYYFLSQLGGFHGDRTEKPIQELGIYFSRFGIMYKFPVSELGNDTDLFNCKKWFYNHANKEFHRGKYIFDYEKRHNLIAEKRIKKIPKKKPSIHKSTIEETIVKKKRGNGKK